MIAILTSRRFWLATLIFIGILTLRTFPFLITLAIMVLALFLNPNTLRPLRNYRFWIVISLLVIVVPLFTGDPDSHFLGIRYSSRKLDQMILMALRGISVFLLFQVLTHNLDSSRMRAFLSRIGLNHFEFLFTLSQESLPTVRSILKARVAQLRNDNRQRVPIRHMFRFATTILEDIINLADKLSLESDTVQPLDAAACISAVQNYPSPPLLIVSGDPGSGKTPWVHQLVTNLRQQEIRVSGLISHKVKSSDENWHHEMEELSSGKREMLNTMENRNQGMQSGKFFFCPGVFDWAQQQISENLESDWMILDEVGPLEMKGKGFFSALQQIDNHYHGVVAITIRANLKDKVDELLGPFERLKKRPRYFVELPTVFGIGIIPQSHS